MHLLAQVSALKVPSKLSYLPDALKLLFGAIGDSSILFFAKQFCLTIIVGPENLPSEDIHEKAIKKHRLMLSGGRFSAPTMNAKT